ncbi:MAG: NADP-dependent oxidoreductase, partial [Pseudomonadota bacterium]
MIVSREFKLVRRPVGFPEESDFQIVETPVPELNAGEALIRTVYLSVDPYMRGRISGARSYAAPVEIGEAMVGEAAGVVAASRYPGLAPGDFVTGGLGWRDYAVAGGKGLRKVDPAIAPIPTYLSVLGGTGLTAYFGLLDIGQPKPGETVLISGAAGAVGSLVGQIAKIHGCRAAGIAGGDGKISHIVNDLGFDAGFNYKKTDDYRGALQELCPNGVDVYFDNVGGAITDAALNWLNLRARVVVCGQISQYNLEKPAMGPRWLSILIAKRARVEGFLVFDYAERYAEATRQMAQWLKEKKLKHREDIVEGFENTPKAFIGMLRG